jgi:ADP-ribose pyrophosphatase YjhB (NUDIX family)
LVRTEIIGGQAMPTPYFLVQLREKIGHDLLLLPGVCGLVFNDNEQILLQRRSDTGRWALPGGIMEPDEVPATAVVREVLEETGVKVVPERITGVYTTPPVTYANGDQAQYVLVGFVCRAVEGEPRVNDDESLEVAYFPLNALPELSAAHRTRIEHACAAGPPWFAPTAAYASDV